MPGHPQFLRPWIQNQTVWILQLYPKGKAWRIDECTNTNRRCTVTWPKWKLKTQEAGDPEGAVKSLSLMANVLKVGCIDDTTERIFQIARAKQTGTMVKKTLALANHSAGKTYILGLWNTPIRDFIIYKPKVIHKGFLSIQNTAMVLTSYVRIDEQGQQNICGRAEWSAPDFRLCLSYWRSLGKKSNLLERKCNPYELERIKGQWFSKVCGIVSCKFKKKKIFTHIPER